MNPIELNFTVDLAKKETQVVRDLNSPLYYGDMNAHTLNITILRNGEPEDLSDVTPYGYIVFESTGDTVELADSSSKSGNVVSVTLTDEAYAVTGRAYIVVQLAKTGTRATVFAVYCWIGLGVTDSIIVPSGSRLDIDALASKIDEFDQKISEVQDLVDDMEDAVASVNDAVKYSSQTGKTDAEKARARENIGAGVPVSGDYAIALDLSDPVSAYVASDVGDKAVYKSSDKTISYRNAVWVTKGCDYVLTCVNGDPVASTTVRVSAIVDSDGIVRQKISVLIGPNVTVDTAFTAETDGFFIPCVDANATSVTFVGGATYTMRNRLSMSPEEFGAYLWGSNGSDATGSHRATVHGNHVHVQGSGAGTTYSTISVAGDFALVTATQTAAIIKKLFTDGHCCTTTLDDGFFPASKAELHFFYNKWSKIPNPNNWSFKVQMCTYNADTDTLTFGYDGTQKADITSRYMVVPLDEDFIATMKANKNFALLLYMQGASYYVSSGMDFYWAIKPISGAYVLNVPQTMTDMEKRIARTNIGAADASGFVDTPVVYWGEADDAVSQSSRRIERQNGHDYIVTGLNEDGTAGGGIYERLSGKLATVSTSSGATGWATTIEFEENVRYTMTLIPLSGELIDKSTTPWLILKDDDYVSRAGFYPVTGEVQSVSFTWPDSTKKGKLIFRSVQTDVIKDFKFRLILTKHAPVSNTFPSAYNASTTIVAVPDVRYELGTINELSFTPSAYGVCEVIFTTGSNPTDPVLPSTVRMPDWWTGVEPNRTYDLMVLNGTLGMVTSWAT